MRDEATGEEFPRSTGFGFPELDRELPPLRKGFRALTCLSLVVLTLLLAALVPSFIRPRAQGRASGIRECYSNLKNIGTALEMYSSDWSGHYPDSVEVLTPNYLRAIPWCPLVEKDTYVVYFGLAAPLNTGGYEEYYYVECHGGNHEAQNVEGHYPAYNGIQGLIERQP